MRLWKNNIRAYVQIYISNNIETKFIFIYLLQNCLETNILNFGKERVLGFRSSRTAERKINTQVIALAKHKKKELRLERRASA